MATARIVSTRPVYGTGYETNLLSFADRGWSFNYSPQNPLDYSDNMFVSNLSSLLSFYAYIVIGMDQDSFAPPGRLALLRPRPQYPDYCRFPNPGKRPRLARHGAAQPYWLLDNLQDPQLEAFRTRPVRLLPPGHGYLH